MSVILEFILSEASARPGPGQWPNYLGRWRSPEDQEHWGNVERDKSYKDDTADEFVYSKD